MPRARANGMEIEYQTFGDPADPTLLLVMGLGGQMILWHEEFCEALAARGHHVVRFDNRDVGLSTKLDHTGLPDVMGALSAVAQGRPIDALYLESVHVVGASMGGMIAQTLAIEHPDRVLTLTSIMSTTGEPGLPQARPEAMGALLTPAPTERAAAIEHGLRLWRTIGSPGFPFDEGEVRERAALAFDRGQSPAGVARQLVAILASGSRRAALASVRAPTLGIHGAADPLIPVEAWRATA